MLSHYMTIVKIILDFIGAIAWPCAILTIALLYRKPIYDLLGHIGYRWPRGHTSRRNFAR
jgi:hypothetical protein